MYPCVLLCSRVSKTSLFLSLSFYRLLRLLDPSTDTSMMPPGHLRVGAFRLLKVVTEPHCVAEQFASSRSVTLLMSAPRTSITHLPDQLWDSGKALDRCGCPSSSAAAQGLTASPLCYFCLLVASMTLLLPRLTFSYVPRVNFMSQRHGISFYSLLSIMSLLNLLSNLVDLYFNGFGTHLICLLRDTFSLISTTRRDFGWSSPWTHSCILSPYHHHSDWKEIWLCSPQLLQFLGCQKHLRKSYCLITS